MSGSRKEVLADALKAEIEAFLGCIRSGRPPVVSGEAGLMALETAMTLGFWAPIHVETECLKLGPDGRLEHGAEHGHP